MKKKSYQSMENPFSVKRRDFLKTGSVVGTGLVLGNPAVWQEKKYKSGNPDRIKTNIEDFVKIPRTKFSLPGLFPGKVVQVEDSKSMPDGKPNQKIIKRMFSEGISHLTEKNLKDSFSLLFIKEDVIGIKVNPVGAGLISTRLEVVDAIIFASDPFALDMVCHKLMVKKRKKMNLNVNEHPRFTEYLHYSQRLGLGITDPKEINHIIV